MEWAFQGMADRIESARVDKPPILAICLPSRGRITRMDRDNPG